MIRTGHSRDKYVLRIFAFSKTWPSLSCGAINVALSWMHQSFKSVLNAGEVMRPAYLFESWKESFSISPQAAMLTGTCFMPELLLKEDVAVAITWGKVTNTKSIAC
jgi:hypothetical protein